MALMKTKTVYVCQHCGSSEPRWLGRCPSCGGWNTFVEERTEKRAVKPPAHLEEPVDLGMMRADETVERRDVHRLYNTTTARM